MTEIKYPKTSPFPLAVKKPEKQKMTFGEAMVKLVEKKTITKSDWPEGWAAYIHEKESIAVLKDPAGKIHSWVISVGDITGEDYIEI